MGASFSVIIGQKLCLNFKKIDIKQLIDYHMMLPSFCLPTYLALLHS